jgi:hypothetical protein
MNLQAINNFLVNVVNFINGFRQIIDFNDIDNGHNTFNFDDDDINNKLSTTIILLASIIFNIFYTCVLAVFNILSFITTNFIAPYVSNVIYYTIIILALITSIILAYYILVKFNQVNTFIDKQYIDFFIKSFQNICKGVS